MSIASEISRIQTNIANAYTSCSNKGATMPVTQNSSNLASTINTISGGGGTSPVEQKDVDFIDYDGTLLYSYTVAEVQQMSSLPPLPSHTGLTCEGWNWTLAELKDKNDIAVVGAIYKPTDENTKIIIEIVNVADNIMALYFKGSSASSGSTIDWGDNSATETVSGTTAVNKTHEYSAPGTYTITISPYNNGKISLAGSSNTSMFGNSSYCKIGSPKVRAVHLGKNISSIATYTFYYCFRLETLTIAEGVSSMSSNYIFYYCRSLKAWILPRSLTSLTNSSNRIFYYSYINTISTSGCMTGTQGLLSAGNGARITKASLPNSVTTGNSFESCYALERVSLSTRCSTVYGNMFKNCYALKKIKIPSTTTTLASGGSQFSGCNGLTEVDLGNVTTLPASLFANCYSLGYIKIPKTVTTVGSLAFSNCTSLKKIDFTDFESVPTLSNVNAFSGTSADLKIVVPDSLYTEWTGTANWSDSTVASKIVKESEA